jgi:hypothetical protein
MLRVQFFAVGDTLDELLTHDPFDSFSVEWGTTNDLLFVHRFYDSQEAIRVAHERDSCVWIVTLTMLPSNECVTKKVLLFNQAEAHRVHLV